MKKIFLLIGLIIGSLLGATGCGTGKEEEKMAEAVTEAFSETTVGVEEMEVPREAKIIGLGEAVHGSGELQTLKQQMLEKLLEDNNIRTFVLEGDFGGCKRVNEYIHGGEGNAKEAVAEIGFAIYRTKEMEQFAEWMREYNDSVSEEEKINFYGCDMQRFDNNKEVLEMYLSKADEGSLEMYRPVLEKITDETMYDVPAESYQKAAESMKQVISGMDGKKEYMISVSSEEEFALARQTANILLQACMLRGGAEKEYSQMRDEYMAGNVMWISEFEKQFHGREGILLSAHTGHIEKTSANLAGYKSMGNHLAEKYGEEYFAIGTEILEAGFNAACSAEGKRLEFQVTNDNPLTQLVKEQERNVVYLSMKAAEGSALKEIVEGKISMLNIGDEFAESYTAMKSFYTIKMVPAKAYDGIILYKETTPMQLQ